MKRQEHRQEPSSRESSTIEILFGKEHQRKFECEGWPRESLVHHGTAERLSSLMVAPEFSTVQRLVASSEGRAIAQHGMETARIQDPLAAQKLYDWGRQIYAPRVTPESEGVRAWLRSLEVGLNLPRGSMRCNVFFCKQGVVTPPFHWDPEPGFVIQIRGRKKWFVRENRCCEHPIFNHALGDSVSAESSLMFAAAPPHSISDAQEFVLEPGSVLYLPGGMWHRTEAIEDSAHLDLEVASPRWVDVIGSLLRGRLRSEGDWRAHARCSPKVPSADLQGTLDGMVERACAALRSLAVEDVVRVSASQDGTAYRVSPGLHIEIDRSETVAALRVREIAEQAEATRIELPLKYHEPLSRMLVLGRPFRVEEIVGGGKEPLADELRRLMTKLDQIDILEVAHA